MMQSAQQTGTLVSHLVMDPDHTGRPAVIVEGSRDKPTYRRLLSESSAPKFLVAGSRDRAIEVVRIATEKSIPTVGIVDADNDSGRRPDFGVAVLTTDRRDLESMIFFTRAGDRVVSDLYDPDAVQMLESRSGATVKDLLASACAVIGAARVANHREGWNLSFKSMELRRYLDRDSLRFDEQAYYSDLMKGRSARMVQLLSDAAAEVRAAEDDAELVCGHDLSEMMHLAATGRLGNPGPASQDVIERLLRVSFTDEDFRTTKLYQRLSRWAQKRQLLLVA